MKKTFFLIYLLLCLIDSSTVSAEIIDASADVGTYSRPSQASLNHEINRPGSLSGGVLFSERGLFGFGQQWDAPAWFRFDLSSLAGLTVTSATFEFTTFSNHSNGFSHDVLSSPDDSWDELTITWDNQPDLNDLTLIDSQNIAGAATYSYDVLAAVNGADGLGGANDLLTLVLRADQNDPISGIIGPHIFENSEVNPDIRPRLVLTTVAATPVPEPASMALWSLIGVAGLGYVRSRRRE